MSLVSSILAEPFEVPLIRGFSTARDTLTRQVTRPVRVTLATDDGIQGVGESVPVLYVTGETQESVVAAVQHAADVLVGLDIRRTRLVCEALSKAIPDHHTARAGIEMALFTARANLLGIGLWEMFGGAVDRIETDVTLSLSDDPETRTAELLADGIRCFKLKVGCPDAEVDLWRVMAVHQIAPDAPIRIDANQAFDANGALVFIDRLMQAGVRLQLVEQPVAKEDLPALDTVAAASPVPIFADEAVKTPAEALRIVHETRVQGINVKLMKSGVTGALDIVAIAKAAGRRLMIGCMLETHLGIGFSVAFACGTGAFDYADLDSHLLLEPDPSDRFFRQSGPYLVAKH